MPLDNQCPFCSSSVPQEAAVCPNCGAALAGSQPVEPIVRPKTIEELKLYCAQHGMPLERMRFFVGEDYKNPKAFGIYRDGRSFVVYKNKADGSRAVRYHGPDEAYAVNELFEKLLSECHNRGIYPDGAPQGSVTRSAPKKKVDTRLLIALTIVSILAAIMFSFFFSFKNHRNDGYYRGDGSGIYYRYGDSWYYGNDSGGWSAANGFPYGDSSDYSDYYVGKTYDSDWGGSDFRDSSIWDDLHSSSDSDYSSDYSDWDSGDTDWDSDW